jgi:hypothetical protein
VDAKGAKLARDAVTVHFTPERMSALIFVEAE